MAKGSFSAEAPAAGRRARWLVLAGAPILLAIAAARGLDPARASAPETIAATARSVAERVPMPAAAPPAPQASTPEPPAPEASTPEASTPERSVHEPPAPGPPRLYSESPPLLSDPRRPAAVAFVAPPPAAVPSLAAPSRPAAPSPSAPSTLDAPSSEPPECVPTPLTSTQLAWVLYEGHIRHFGTPPHADRWACAWAHCAFEQDRGGEIYSNNLGHITAPVPPGSTARPTGRVCRRRMRERLTKGPDRWALVHMWFRVFETPEEGAEAYWRLLANSYYSVIARCDSADPRGAAQRLAEIGYFTGPEQPYIEGMARLFVSARGSLIPRLMAERPLTPSVDPAAP